MSTPSTSVSPVGPTENDSTWNGGFVRWFINITDWIKSLSPAGASVYDTRRVIVAPGISYRRVGKAVEVAVSVTAGCPVGLSTLAAAAIPPSLWPPGTNARGECYLGDAQIGQLFVDSATGDVGVIQQTGATRGLAQGLIRYFVD